MFKWLLASLLQAVTESSLILTSGWSFENVRGKVFQFAVSEGCRPAEA